MSEHSFLEQLAAKMYEAKMKRFGTGCGGQWSSPWSELEIGVRAEWIQWAEDARDAMAELVLK